MASFPVPHGKPWERASRKVQASSRVESTSNAVYSTESVDVLEISQVESSQSIQAIHNQEGVQEAS